MHRLLAAALLCLSTFALADLTIVNEIVSDAKTRVTTLSARGGKAYFELKEPDGTLRTMLRDGEAQKLYIIDHPKKTVMVITEQDSKQMMEKQAELRAQLQAQLAKVPAEQRARMEATMLGQLPAAPKPPVFSYEKKKGLTRKIAGISCQDYLVKRDGQPAGEGCFAAWKDLSVSGEDFRSTMLKAMPSSATSMLGQSFESQENAPGFPVWRSYVNAQGEVTSQTTLKSLSKSALAAERFEVPKDYQQKTMGQAMGAREQAVP